MNERRIARPIKVLVNKGGLSLECERMLYKSLLNPTMMYGSETINEGGRERIRVHG